MSRSRLRAAPLAGLLLAGALAACQSSALPPATEPPATEPPAGQPAQWRVPPAGSATHLDVASWNIEWFGSTTRGPADEALQRQNAREVIGGTDADVWGVAEITSQEAWDALEGSLPGYSGVLAGEPAVAGGPAAYGPSEQKVGILFRSEVATLLGARVILTEHDHAFAGRPPLEARLRVSLNGATEEVVVIVLHMKAFNDSASWARRQAAGSALKAYLDAAYPTQKVFVIGDWNDDVDSSITPGRPTPYAAFVGDAARYAFPTAALSAARVSSTTGYPDLIDHHLVTNEAFATREAASTRVYRVDAYLDAYDQTTSDHFPVLTRYAWPGR